MSNRFLKNNIDDVSIRQFQLDYICETNHPLHKILAKLCHDVQYMWWGGQ